ncbi:MAG: nucleotidyltransferase domain-containing protein [Actinomycetota bacterium]|nr:nucleotidyltransferase domain-containing protein [Actinomycetota bacterium]
MTSAASPLDGLALAPHHAESIANATRAFEDDPTCRALVLGGSIAHGFASPSSDIDVTIVVDTEEYERRRRDGVLHLTDFSICTYEGGYLDGKYVDLDFLRRVAAEGSDPARFAYQGARVLLSEVPDLDAVLASIARYPIEQKDERIDRFAAQAVAWSWYHREGARRDDAYVITLAVQKVVLFTCRIVLAANEALYPFHKWMLRVTASATDRPADLMQRIDALLAEPSTERSGELCRRVFDHYGIDTEHLLEVWPTRFLEDTELTWMSGHTPIDDW